MIKASLIRVYKINKDFIKIFFLYFIIGNFLIGFLLPFFLYTFYKIEDMSPSNIRFYMFFNILQNGIIFMYAIASYIILYNYTTTIKNIFYKILMFSFLGLYYILFVMFKSCSLFFSPFSYLSLMSYQHLFINQ